MSYDELATRCCNCGRAGRDTAEQPLPDDWIEAYDGAVDDGPTGLLCPDCQTAEAIVEYMGRRAEADAIIAQTMRDIRVDDVLGRPAGGRASDAMMGIPPPDEHDDEGHSPVSLEGDPRTRPQRASQRRPSGTCFQAKAELVGPGSRRACPPRGAYGPLGSAAATAPCRCRPQHLRETQ